MCVGFAGAGRNRGVGVRRTVIKLRGVKKWRKLGSAISMMSSPFKPSQTGTSEDMV